MSQRLVWVALIFSIMGWLSQVADSEQASLNIFTNFASASKIELEKASSLATNVQATATYYVATNGNDSNAGTQTAPWRTIQNAANKVTPGATVLVRGGIYQEKVNFGVSGSASNGYITFANYPGEIPIVDGNGIVAPQDTTGLFNISDKSYLIIKGFELRNYRSASANATPIGIFVQGSSHHIELRNNSIHNIETTANSGNAHGLAVYGSNAPQSSHDIIVDNNHLYNLKLGFSESLAINGNVEQFSVTNNLIHDNDNIGVDIIGFENVAPNPTYDQARNGVVQGNRVYNITSANNPAYNGARGADGIYVDGGRDITIEQNIVSGSDIGVELASEHGGKNTSNVILRNNLVYNNLVVGISIGGYAADKGGTQNCTIINNTLFHNSTLGEGAEFNLQFNALNNTFKNNIVLGDGLSNLVNNNSSQNSGNLLDYNFYYTSTGSGSWMWIPPNSVTNFNTYKTQSGNETHSIFSNPLFLDSNATAPNLRVAPTSPVINAGQNSTDSGTLDVFGQTRLQENQVDVGAVETAFCAAALTINKTSDDASCGTLRLAANTAKSGQTITIALASGSTINLNSTIRLAKGVNLTASAGCANGPQITLQGNGASSNGLALSGGNKVENLTIGNFTYPQVIALIGGRNTLNCVRVIARF